MTCSPARLPAYAVGAGVAPEGGPAGQDGLDHDGVPTVEPGHGDPVANGRQVAGTTASWRSRPAIDGIAIAGRRRDGPGRLVWAATTRAGRQPAASNGRKAVAQPGSQPRSESVWETGAAVGWSMSAHPLQLAGALRVPFRSPEGPQAERDEHDAHDHQRQTSYMSAETGVPSSSPARTPSRT